MCICYLHLTKICGIAALRLPQYSARTYMALKNTATVLQSMALKYAKFLFLILTYNIYTRFITAVIHISVEFVKFSQQHSQFKSLTDK